MFINIVLYIIKLQNFWAKSYLCARYCIDRWVRFIKGL